MSDQTDTIEFREQEEIPGRRPHRVVISGTSGQEWIQISRREMGVDESLAVDLSDMC